MEPVKRAGRVESVERAGRAERAERAERSGSVRAFALLGTVQSTLIFTITLIAVPLPEIGREFRLDPSGLFTVSVAYGLSFSGLLLFGG
ncbi:hypothetical protein ACFQX6_33880 [Streptosporangium lutulentum]